MHEVIWNLELCGVQNKIFRTHEIDSESYTIDRSGQFNLDRRYKSQHIIIIFDSRTVNRELDFCEVKPKIVWDYLKELKGLDK